jgi:hypothetical protein
MALALVGCGARTVGDQEPTGLTRHGDLVWNLDALLHDRFGTRDVYINFAFRSETPLFSTRFIDEASSNYYVYTFARAQRSRFRVLHPRLKPGQYQGATGGLVPMLVGTGYISCGKRLWLYSRWGQDIPEGDLLCIGEPSS